MNHLGFVKNKPVLTFYEKGARRWGGGNQSFPFRDYLAPNSTDALFPFFFSLLHMYMANYFFNVSLCWLFLEEFHSFILLKFLRLHSGIRNDFRQAVGPGVAPRPASSASPGNWSEVQILGPCPRLAEWQTRESGLCSLCWTSSPGSSHVQEAMELNTRKYWCHFKKLQPSSPLMLMTMTSGPSCKYVTSSTPHNASESMVLVCPCSDGDTVSRHMIAKW